MRPISARLTPWVTYFLLMRCVTAMFPDSLITHVSLTWLFTPLFVMAIIAFTTSLSSLCGLSNRTKNYALTTRRKRASRSNRDVIAARRTVEGGCSEANHKISI